MSAVTDTSGNNTFRALQAAARSTAVKTGEPDTGVPHPTPAGVFPRPWEGTAAWDISTGDPIVPAPRSVTIDRLLGDPIVLLGYAAETTIAEKA
jgi:hypothetical protein